MTEKNLIHFMGHLDPSLLNDTYMEEDLTRKKQKRKKLFAQSIFRKGTVFTIQDSLQTAVDQKREMIDTVVAHSYEEEPLRQKIESKVRTIAAVASGIVAMIVLTVSVITMIVKKKSLAKIGA